MKSGLTITEAFGMSALVLAGSAQYVSLTLWSYPLNAAAIIFATLAINLRYILMGASLRPWISGISPARTYGLLFFLVDENVAGGLTGLAFGREMRKITAEIQSLARCHKCSTA